MLGIIGGTGLTKLTNLEITRRQVTRTPYGEPSGALIFGRLCGAEVVFLARHGYGHTIPPHEVNYRANIWALKEHVVDRIASVATVGGINAAIAPGSLVVPDQLIDYTWGRAQTFAVAGEKPVPHLDFTAPYCSDMRRDILRAAANKNIPVRDGGVYACAQGPRLETAAEIDRLERDGADIVGMTGMPEAVLARELDLEYVMLALVVNAAAGRGDSTKEVSMADIQAIAEAGMVRVRRIIQALEG